MKKRIFTVLVIVFVVGLITNYSLRNAPSKDDVTVSPAPAPTDMISVGYTDSLDKLIAAVYSRRCETSQGVCWVRRPKPLGKDCFCGDIPGTIVR